MRGLKMKSELIHLLLDKTMARPEPRNRQTNPPNRPKNCKTVFVDSQRCNAAGRTLTRSDKYSVLKILQNGMQNLSILTNQKYIRKTKRGRVCEVTRVDKHFLIKCADHKAQIRKAFIQLNNTFSHHCLLKQCLLKHC